VKEKAPGEKKTVMLPGPSKGTLNCRWGRTQGWNKENTRDRRTIRTAIRKKNSGRRSRTVKGKFHIHQKVPGRAKELQKCEEKEVKKQTNEEPHKRCMLSVEKSQIKEVNYRGQETELAQRTGPGGRKKRLGAAVCRKKKRGSYGRGKKPK